MKNLTYLIFCLMLSTPYALAKYKLENIFNANEVIWGFDFVSKNEILITLKSGKLYYYNLKSKKKKSLKAPNSKLYGQGGLMDIRYFNYSHNPNVYITFAEEYEGTVTTSLAHGLYNEKTKSIDKLKTIFRAKVKSDTGRHFGSRVEFKDDLIFMTIGDRGERKYSQDLSYHNGSIVRLTLDGKFLSSNPFVKKQGARPEIWSWGHRNPQGIAKHPITRKLYALEFGPKGGDELNLIEKGNNYGWPIITHGTEYHGPKIGPTHKKGLEQPLVYWTPSISPSGMTFYTGDKIPEWKNHLFLACLGSRHLRRLVLKGDKVIKQEMLFEDKIERIRQVRTGLDGYLYFSTDSGKIVKVSKK